MLLPIRFDVFPCPRFDTLYLTAEVARSSFIVFSRFEEIPNGTFHQHRRRNLRRLPRPRRRRLCTQTRWLYGL